MGHILPFLVRGFVAFMFNSLLFISACGLALGNTRIMGGQESAPGIWPWQVSLNTDEGPLCAGSLITSQWVLTAAHCLRRDPDTIKVFLGRNSQSGPNPNEVSRTIHQVRCHDSFEVLTNNNDICLLRLSAPVNSNDHINPICLASADSTFHSGIGSWVAGWGSTAYDNSSDILRDVNLPIVGNHECKCSHRLLTENMICAGLRAGGKDACRGDSGAPLVTKRDSVWVQSGIVSYGDGCAEPMNPGVYTRVSKYQEWISKITGSSKPGFVTFSSSGVDSDSNYTCATSQHKTTSTTAASVQSRVLLSPSADNGSEDGKIEARVSFNVADGAENMIHFSRFTHFTAVCAVGLLLT
ncbi:Serine protease 27 [Nibea albiflora]|uniref:Serine protease 27 n=1 Tax=Nibea albiflora TaxID=240163 RepID=A0ACB7EUW6_NIBAL|nr:Serine protease 27 [Nibea albiflora]